MPTKYPSPLGERTALDAKTAEHYGTERLDAIDAARQLVKEHELKVGDLVVVGRPRKGNARYWDPKTGQTWAGRGRPPRWIEGQDRKPFEIS